jgi:hypothetical protein
MAVPVAAVNEDDLPEFWEYQVGFARKIGDVQSESVSARTSYSPHEEFRFSILTPDKRHSLAALGSRKRVHARGPIDVISGNCSPTTSRSGALWKSYTAAVRDARKIIRLFIAT